MTSANEFLMAGGVPSAKFATPGTTVAGTVAREPEVQQQRDFTSGEAKFWDDGKPMQQLQVILATSERDPQVPDDDGQRAVYVKGNLLKAVREAIRKSGANGIKIGGTLTVTYTGDGESTRRGMNPPKLYAATYTPPAAAAAGEFLAGGEQRQQGSAFTQAVAPELAQAPNGLDVFKAQSAPAAATPAPAGVSPEAMAALQQLTPEQRAALNL
jgi:hypothetical protein